MHCLAQHRLAAACFLMLLHCGVANSQETPRPTPVGPKNPATVFEDQIPKEDRSLFQALDDFYTAVAVGEPPIGDTIPREPAGQGGTLTISGGDEIDIGETDESALEGLGGIFDVLGEEDGETNGRTIPDDVIDLLDLGPEDNDSPEEAEGGIETEVDLLHDAGTNYVIEPIYLFEDEYREPRLRAPSNDEDPDDGGFQDRVPEPPDEVSPGGLEIDEDLLGEILDEQAELLGDESRDRSTDRGTSRSGNSPNSASTDDSSTSSTGESQSDSSRRTSQTASQVNRPSSTASPKSVDPLDELLSPQRSGASSARNRRTGSRPGNSASDLLDEITTDTRQTPTDLKRPGTNDFTIDDLLTFDQEVLNTQPTIEELLEGGDEAARDERYREQAEAMTREKSTSLDEFRQRARRVNQQITAREQAEAAAERQRQAEEYERWRQQQIARQRAAQQEQARREQIARQQAIQNEQWRRQQAARQQAYDQWRRQQIAYQRQQQAMVFRQQMQAAGQQIPQSSNLLPPTWPPRNVRGNYPTDPKWMNLDFKSFNGF